jgi:hypothetical protein
LKRKKEKAFCSSFPQSAETRVETEDNGPISCCDPDYTQAVPVSLTSLFHFPTSPEDVDNFARCLAAVFIPTSALRYVSSLALKRERRERMKESPRSRNGAEGVNKDLPSVSSFLSVGS